MRNTIILLKIISLFLIVLTSCNKKSPTENAPATYILHGVVSDNGAEYLGSGAEPVANASVTLTDQADDQNIYSGNTNDQGEYSITVPASGQYKLQITGENIETYVQEDLLITKNTVLNITVYRTFTDIDGNVYQVVKIGDQTWMAENLKVTHYRDGTAIPNVIENIQWTNLLTGAYCEQDNDSSNVSTYGRLYNWYAVNDNRNIAPEGWHVPTDEEFKTLEKHLGMSQSEADNYSWPRGTDEGSKLKETGTIHWQSPNTGATNESGFFALPGSYRSGDNGFFNRIGSAAHFWSATSNDGVVDPSGNRLSAWSRYLLYNDSYISRHRYKTKRYGLSLRLVKD
jgi:uncharacterized protein (TIGR02145 family)